MNLQKIPETPNPLSELKFISSFQEGKLKLTGLLFSDEYNTLHLKAENSSQCFVSQRFVVPQTSQEKLLQLCSEARPNYDLGAYLTHVHVVASETKTRGEYQLRSTKLMLRFRHQKYEFEPENLEVPIVWVSKYKEEVPPRQLFYTYYHQKF